MEHQASDEAFRFVSADVKAGRSIHEDEIGSVLAPPIDQLGIDGTVDKVD